MNSAVTASLPARLRAFAGRVGASLLAWIFVAAILAAFAHWDGTAPTVASGATALTGAERPANLAHLNDAPADQADAGEPTNRQNFTLAPTIQEAKVDYEIFLNPDCSPRTNFYLVLLEKPRHGTVRIDPDKNYSGYDSDSQRYRCNLLPIASPSIFYRRNPGFTGSDHFAVEVFEPGGDVRTTTYLMDVR